MLVGVIGGTGFYDLLANVRAEVLTTPYGQATVYFGHYRGKGVAFIPRHGQGHRLLAHQVNYAANLIAFKEAGVERVLATCAVGSLNLDFQVGDLVLLHQFVDHTSGRFNSFGKISVNMADPYCPELRNCFLQAAQELGTDLHATGTYICVNGPRYETRAEIQLFRKWGMDVVGMTNATEATLARELGLCYSTLAIVTDLAAGISDIPPDLDTHRKVVQANQARLAQLLLQTVTLVPEKKGCACEATYQKALSARHLRPPDVYAKGDGSSP
ncbi:MAG: MTAP family purine nucleoside phosphorylase [Firmicutes bacterium]|nr:MTAP family purine nucleoside phosphorylase [Bacillota bacterium]MCL5040694.1 MTAP family purine nucleoside phosphorylase [Bacillota bacterium]